MIRDQEREHCKKKLKKRKCLQDEKKLEQKLLTNRE